MHDNCLITKTRLLNSGPYNFNRSELGRRLVRSVRGSDVSFPSPTGRWRFDHGSSWEPPTQWNFQLIRAGKSWGITLACSVIVILGTLAELASVASTIVVNKDWIVILAGGDQERLAGKMEFIMKHSALFLLVIFKEWTRRVVRSIWWPTS